MKEQFEHESLLPEEKKCFERSEFIQSQNVYVNLLAGFPASSNRSLPMRFRVFCNLADSSRVKTNQEIMTFTDKINYQM